MKKTCLRCKKNRDLKFFSYKNNKITKVCIDCKLKKIRTEKKESISALKKKAWKSFSDYIRTRDSINSTGTTGYCVCVTCNQRVEYKNIQAGHVISGRTNAILFNEQLVNGQCQTCNMFRGGEYTKYALWFIDRYGKKALEQAELNKQTITKITKEEYKQITEEYINKLKILELYQLKK